MVRPADFIRGAERVRPMSAYAHPEALTETNWLADRLGDPSVRVIEVDYDPASNYEQGHIPGAVLFDWQKDINDPVRREILSQPALTALLRKAGISPDTSLVLYGDFNNWFAAFAFWVLSYYGVRNVRILNGGRAKWIAEGRPLSKEVPTHRPGTIQAKTADPSLRAFQSDVRAILPGALAGAYSLVDVRGPKEFSGELTAPPEYPTEQAQRGGHIPSAKNIPWAQAVRSDGTFKSPEELAALYEAKGIRPDRPVITYCRIGERSSHTWFVLRYLLGYPDVRNYDGSWTEWGNSIGAPIER